MPNYLWAVAVVVAGVALFAFFGGRGEVKAPAPVSAVVAAGSSPRPAAPDPAAPPDPAARPDSQAGPDPGAPVDPKAGRDPKAAPDR